MIKTIKVKKQLRLDELIKYIFDNDIKDKGFRIHDEVEDERYLTVSQQGMIRLGFGFYPEDTFTVEVEEYITKETVFPRYRSYLCRREQSNIIRDFNK